MTTSSGRRTPCAATNVASPCPPSGFRRSSTANTRARKSRSSRISGHALGTWLVSAALADVLRRFGLGQTSLYPTKAFQIDRKTPVAGEYLCINFGETKATFLPEQSRAKSRGKIRTYGNSSLHRKTDDIALSDAALEGPGLWIEQHFIDAFFLSHRVVRALRDAKLAGRFGLRRCRVISRS